MIITPKHEKFFSLIQNKNTFLRAVAGAGKTTTLTRAASLLNGHTLFVSFNKFIADTIKSKYQLDARTCHGLAYNLLPSNKIEKLKELNIDSFYSAIIKAAIEELESSYIDNNQYIDNIFVDEIQDITLEQAKFLSLFIQKNGIKRVVVSGDHYQTLYQFSGIRKTHLEAVLGLLGIEEASTLDVSFRCPSMATQFLREVKNPFLPVNIHSLSNANQGNVLFNDYIVGPLKGTTFVLSRTRAESFDYFCAMQKQSVNPVWVDPVLNSKISHMDKRGNFLLQKFLSKGIIFTKNNLSSRPVEGKVNFITIHRSKGLEADNVCLMNFEGLWNSMSNAQSFRNQERIWELNNLFYVASTRTKNSLQIIH